MVLAAFYLVTKCNIINSNTKNLLTLLVLSVILILSTAGKWPGQNERTNKMQKKYDKYEIGFGRREDGTAVYPIHAYYEDPTGLLQQDTLEEEYATKEEAEKAVEALQNA